MQRTLERLKPIMHWVELRDCLVFGGLGAAGYGLSLLHPAAGWVFVGVALFWLGARST